MIDQLPTRRGHFVLESGHHGDMWLDLELLCLRPDRVRPFANELAARLRKYGAEVVCGPLVEGAFLALMVASEMGFPFTYSEPLPDATHTPKGGGAVGMGEGVRRRKGTGGQGWGGARRLLGDSWAWLELG